MTQILRNKTIVTALLLLMMMPFMKSANADDIHLLLPTRTGVLWEGFSVNKSFTETAGVMYEKRPWVACIITSYSFCASASELTTINGMKALKLKSTTGRDIKGLGLVPRLNVTATYTPRGAAKPETMTGTIGFPETLATTTNGDIVPEDPSKPWKLFLRNSDDPTFFEPNSKIDVHVSGSWMLVADGSQIKDVVQLTKKQLSLTLFAGAGVDLFPDSKLHVRVTTMECSIDTPRLINFGAVEKTTHKYAEIARRTEEFTALCTPDTHLIGADVRVQFRAISGIYKDHPGRLAFQAAGSTENSGFITGSIANKSEGPSMCYNPNGIQFDGTPTNIARVYNSTFENKVYPNTITWRLCSGDELLPDGRIHAAAEMLVTFF